jgi:uncharacterized membrane protein
MDGAGWVLAAAVAFLGTHFLLSHPLRGGMVAHYGATGFLGIYSLVAAVTFGLLVLAFWFAPATAPWWSVGDGLWGVVTAVMLIASILFAGSFIGNPALPNPNAGDGEAPVPHGVFRITRHPMMWGFALWGLCHIAVMPTTANAVLAGAVALLALVGAGLQDRKKEKLQPQRWREWEKGTSYWPFARGVIWPGWGALLAGALLWLAATWAHLPLAGWPAGIWRWIG